MLDIYQYREFFVNEILPPNYITPQNAVPISNTTPLYLQMPEKIDDFCEYFNYPKTTSLLDNSKIPVK